TASQRGINTQAPPSGAARPAPEGRAGDKCPARLTHRPRPPYPPPPRAARASPPPASDWKALRARANAGQAYLASLIAPSANVTISTCAAAATDGTPAGLRWYARRGPLRALLWSTRTAAAWSRETWTPTTRWYPCTSR